MYQAIQLPFVYFFVSMLLHFCEYFFKNSGGCCKMFESWCDFSYSLFFIAYNLGFGSNFLFLMHANRNISDPCGTLISKTLAGTEALTLENDLKFTQSVLKYTLWWFRVKFCNTIYLFDPWTIFWIVFLI